MSDLADGRIIAATFTGSTGKGSGAVPQGRKLLNQVAGVFNSVSADGAYDAEDFRVQARDKGDNLLCPLPSNVVYGKDKPLRNELKHQIGKIGDKEWRKRWRLHVPVLI